MKKSFLTFLMVPSIVFAADNSIFDDKTWYLDNNTLSAKRHEPFSFDGHVFDHSINFVTPAGGHGSSDACALSSPTSLNCYSGDSVTYNPETHAATLISRFNGSYTYYDKDYAPEKSALSGNWHRMQQSSVKCRNSEVVSIVIPYQEKNATAFNNIDIYTLTGFQRGASYYLVKDQWSGQIALSPTRDKVYYFSYYLYDANNNPIYDFDKVNTLVKLNDGKGKLDDQCHLMKTN